MNKNEIKNRIEEVEKELAQLRQDLEKEDKGIWKPDDCEDYYYIGYDGELEITYNSNLSVDYDIIAFGNYYKTREEAEYQAKVQKYTNLFRKYVEEHGDLIDWQNRSKEKWYTTYNFSDKKIYYTVCHCCKQQGTIYASSEQILKDAVEFVGEDNVIKYVLGVK